MQSSTYQDIIENKIEEWRMNIEKLEERARKAGTSGQEKFGELIAKLKSSVDAAVEELRDLDKKETTSNTVITKNKILEIFDSIDRDLIDHEEKTPYML